MFTKSWYFIKSSFVKSRFGCTLKYLIDFILLRDPWLANPKQHEAPGGRYANGIITNTYQAGQEVTVRVQITTNHKGYFEFKLCSNNDPTNDKDQTCFDE